METLWIVISLLLGGLAVYVLIKPRLTSSISELASEKVRAAELDAARQKLEIENAGLHSAAGCVPRLAAEVDENRATILSLTERHSVAMSSVSDRDSTIGNLRSQILALSEEAGETRKRATDLEIEKATIASAIVEREKALREERIQFTQTTAAFRAQFAELSAEALKENGEKFLETAKRVLALQHQAVAGDLEKRQAEIRDLVKPIEDGIKAVGDAAREMELNRATAFGSIEEQLRSSVASAVEVAKQAGALKDALRRPNVRGRWGEVQLKICVELAGMEEHCDVEFQETTLSLEEEALRPDMIVRMPGGRKITVDSKTPMVHFLSYIEASSDDERHAALVNHGRSVKKHVGNLAKTDYMQKIADGPDFVVMFLPNESFLAMALEKEPTFMEEALKRKVLVATPATLIGLLKVVRFGWNEEKIAENAQRIADEGCKLNSEIVKFLADFAKLSIALDSVNAAFVSSKRRVENQIVRRSLSLAALGAPNTSSFKKSKKVLQEVENLLKAAGADDADIAHIENPEHMAIAAASAGIDG